MTDKTPEEAAVLEAVAEYLNTPSGSSPRSLAYKKLKDVHAAIRASRKAKGVKPEEVDPGTRFRLMQDASESICIMMRHDAKPAFRWDDEDPNVCRSFMPCDSMVIPIQEEEWGECERGEDYSNVIDRHHCSKCGNVL